MTQAADSIQMARAIGGAVEATSPETILVPPDMLLEVATYIKTLDGGDFNYLDMITAVDCNEYFELVYRFVSLAKNNYILIKTRVPRENPAVSSLTGLWKSADFQERELFDLFGIAFNGHSCLRRIMLWEGFEGYPLRKDYGHGS
jgi:NADH-quinone oxidoreductase subunit C